MATELENKYVRIYADTIESTSPNLITRKNTLEEAKISDIHKYG